MIDPAEVAASLSDAQRDRLAAMAEKPGSPDGVIGDLANAGLIDVFVRKDATGIVVAWNWTPTSLGLAVREILLARGEGRG